MKLIFKILAPIIVILAAVYFLGPRSTFEKVDNQPIAITYPFSKLDYMIQQREAHIPGIKDDNQSQFIWMDSLHKTKYAVVYLHGFSASHGEAHPILQNFAERYGCNTYLPRLALHGLEDVDALKDLTPKALVDSAKDAIAIGKSIGDSLIVISTSTGSTLAFYLAANDPGIHALICTSPNFDLYDSRSELLVGPWGKQIFRQMMGSDYRDWNTNNPEINKYWTTKNRIESHIALRDLLNQTMSKKTFETIHQPVFIGYYYRDEENMDDIISIDAIQHFSSLLGTENDKISIQAFANARGHVISSQYMNPHWEDVQNSIYSFADNIVGMHAVRDSVSHQ